MEENSTNTSLNNLFILNTDGNSRTNRSLNIKDKKRNIFILKNYYNNTYKLENQALRNSFGKMIKSKNDTSPKFSFPKEKRFYQDFKKEDINYYTKIFNQIKISKDPSLTYRSFKYKKYQTPKNYLDKVKTLSVSSGVKCPTDFLYFPPPTNIYKYPFLPKFTFGKGLREYQRPIKLYEHYYKGYDKETDEENIDRKWRKRIIGGDIGGEDRFIEDKKFYHDSMSPGPGKYNPNYNFFKYYQHKNGYMGIKLKEDQNTIYTDKPKKISLDAFHMKHSMGTIYNQNKTLDRNIRFKMFQKESNINNNTNETNKVHFRKLKKIYVNKTNSPNMAKVNITFNK